MRSAYTRAKNSVTGDWGTPTGHIILELVLLYSLQYLCGYPFEIMISWSGFFPFAEPVVTCLMRTVIVGASSSLNSLFL